MKNIPNLFLKAKGIFFSKYSLLFLLLILFCGLAFIYDPGKNKFRVINIPSPAPEPSISQTTENSPGAVLSSNYQVPQIYISGGEQGYSSGGMIALASTDEPAVVIGGYNTSGEAEISMYEATETDILDYL